MLTGLSLPGADQIGIVVESIESAVPRYAALMRDLGEWRSYTYSPDTVTKLIFRGEPSRYAMRIALAGMAPQIELIQPLVGPSIYQEWLDQHGPGLHHIGVFVDDLESSLSGWQECAVGAIQEGYGFGADGTGAFAYLDTTDLLGVILELIERPAQRRPPEQIWP